MKKRLITSYIRGISCLMMFLLFYNAPAFAQEKTASVSGIVRGENGSVLSSVSVIAKNLQNDFSAGTQTDSNGIFRFSNLPAIGQYNFTFSIVGYADQTLSGYTLKAGETTSVIVKLNSLSKELDQVVVVGYGSQKKKDITTSVVGIRSKDLENLPISNAAEAMVGKMAGVQVTQGSGAPGSSLSIKVRGVGTITAGTDPLYVIDGVPISGKDITTINTYDIESIEVLKDASSAAIYGSRGSNGVVLITTKQGKKGKTIINANSYVGIQQVAKQIDMMDAYQYSQMVLDARNNTYSDQMEANNRKRAASGLPPITFGLNDNNGTRLANTSNNTNVIIPQEILPYLDGQKGLTNTDWQSQIFRKARVQDHTISASGGNEFVKYYSSLDYFNQEGVVLNSNFERYSARLNVEANKGIFKFGANFNPSSNRQKIVNANGAYTQKGIIASALHNSPIWPVYNADGSYNFSQNSWSSNSVTTLPGGANVSGNAQTQAWNPVALAMLPKDEVVSNRMIGNFFTQADILKNLKYRISFGVDIKNSREDEFSPSTIPQSNTAGNPESISTGSSTTTQEMNWVLEQTLNYETRINDHSLNVLLGWTDQKDDIRGNYAFASGGFISNQITTLNAGIVTEGNSSQTQWSLASGLARLQYNYKGKYLLTASMRADGSSKFGANNRWAYFPSASAGWRISDETFMQNVSFISDLKLRASYGLTGNFKIPNYGALGSLAYYAYVFGGASPAVINGAAPSSQPNPDLSWEKTAQTNFGLDVSFFKNNLTLNLDIYNSNTNDLLLNVPVPMSTGYRSQLQNIGKVNNKGFELNLSTQQQMGKLNWTASANYSRNINKVVALGPGNADIIQTGSVGNAYFLTRVEQPIGSYYLPQVLGVFKTQKEVDAYPHYMDAASNFDLATTKPGDFKFLDADGDGVIDFNKDRVVLGSYDPKFTYGFSLGFQYSGFDLSGALQGVYGNKILNLSRRYFYNDEGNMNNYVGMLNRWKSESDPGSGFNVRANRVSKGQNGITSSWHVEDGSYARIRNITLGYSMPEAILKKYKIQKIRLYASLQNPFTFTKYSGYNPEVSNRSNATTNGEDYGVYPTSKTTSIGINLTF